MFVPADAVITSDTSIFQWFVLCKAIDWVDSEIILFSVAPMSGSVQRSCFNWIALVLIVVVVIAFAHDYIQSLLSYVFPKQLITLSFLFACFTKSAQYPFSGWLTDAMTAPTPVSALIHAATMVTAGVFLLLRFSSLLGISYHSLCGFCCALTTLLGLIALNKSDLKKLIAFSTLSQLGWLCFQSAFLHSTVHVITNAGFKALLFLIAATVFHSSTHSQSLYRFGGLYSVLLASYSLLLISLVSLAGFPFFSGFYSKDFILRCSFNSYVWSEFYSFWIIFFGLSLTIAYSTKIIVCFSRSASTKIYIGSIVTFKYCVWSLVCFALFSVDGGNVFCKFFVSEFSSFSVLVFLEFNWTVLI